MMDEAVEVNQYSDVVLLVQQASIAVANHRQYEALGAYNNALKIAQKLERSRLIAVLLNRRGLVLQRNVSMTLRHQVVLFSV